MRVALRKPLLQHKQRGHHDQSYVALPGLPLPGLIMRHPDMTLGILKSSIQKRCACMRASFTTLVPAGALFRLYLIVLGAPTSFRTIKCQQCAVALCLSHSHTLRCSSSTINSPFVVLRRVFLYQADAGCFFTHLRTSIGCTSL